jgi:hypothetical protein
MTLESHSIFLGEGCPVSQKQGRIGPRGCGFALFMQQLQTTDSENFCPVGPRPTEQNALTDLLMPKLPRNHETCGLKDADVLNPTDDEVLSAAFSGLGVPTRAVLTRAELMGPRTGWRDGHLSSLHGFCPPDPSASPIALAQSPGIRFLHPSDFQGRVWSELCDRLADIVSQGEARESILNLPNVDSNTIPDDALWAAVVCLGILAHTYRYEERYSGHEGSFHIVFWLTFWGNASHAATEAGC